MLREEAIAKDVLFPYLEQDRAFQKVPGEFWQTFLNGLLDYEHDPKPIFEALYRLELKDPEKIIQRLPHIYNNFLEDLAEQYVMGKAYGIVQKSGLLKNTRFREHILFFKDLQNVMAIFEREKMIEELPAAYSAISEEISDEEISKLITQKGRDQLKEKFQTWEEEIEMDEVNEANEVSYSQSYQMSFPYKSFEIKEEELFVQPSAKKVKSASSIKPWILGIALVIFLGFLIWLWLR
ncbi:MAG: hypothetical protein R6W85_05670 [Gillisia sp.]